MSDLTHLEAIVEQGKFNNILLANFGSSKPLPGVASEAATEGYIDYVLSFIIKPSNEKRLVNPYGTTPYKVVLLQTLETSSGIRLGYANQGVISALLEESGYVKLPTTVTAADGMTLAIDHLVQKQGVIYMIEQKAKDDHDSSNRLAQLKSFIKKYETVVALYPGIEVVPIFYFLDSRFYKNKKYFQKQIELSGKGDTCKLLYEEELFSFLGLENPLDGIKENFKRVREEMGSERSINFDLHPRVAANYLLSKKKSVLMRIFSNPNLVDFMTDTIFPSGDTFKTLVSDLNLREGYEDLVALITASIPSKR